MKKYSLVKKSLAVTLSGILLFSLGSYFKKDAQSDSYVKVINENGEELVVLAMFGTSGNMLTSPGRDVFDDNYKNGDWVYDKAIVITLIVTYKE